MTRPFTRLLHLGNVVVDVVLTIPALPEPGADVLATSTETAAGGGHHVEAAPRRGLRAGGEHIPARLGERGDGQHDVHDHVAEMEQPAERAGHGAPARTASRLVASTSRSRPLTLATVSRAARGKACAP